MASNKETIEGSECTSKMSSTTPQIITMKNFKYYKEQGKVVSNKEIQLNLLEKEKERKDLIDESMKRKQKIGKIDSKRVNENNQRLNEIQLEAQKRAMHLLERANNIKIEQEEEIQKCSRFILETKCRAVRDAQIVEKNIINQELEEDEQYINDMMENERRLAIKLEAENNKKELMRKRKYAEALKSQILENEVKQQMEIQRKQEENRINCFKEMKTQEDEILRFKAQQIQNAKTRRSLAEFNSQLKHFKEVQEEENRIMDDRIQEYHRMKQQRDRENALKQKLARLQREKEKEKVAFEIESVHKIKDQGKRVNDLRIKEEVEKKWRLKEKEEALEGAKSEIILKMAREEQVKEKQIMTALEIRRDKEQMNKNASILNQAIQDDIKEKSRKNEKAMHHRSELLRQINEKENERKRMRQLKLEEGLNMRKEMVLRKNKLQAAISEKYIEMQKNNVPEKYIREMMNTLQNVI